MSECGKARTLESTPGPPINLKLLASTTSQIKIGWEPPANPNGILTSYHVYCNDIPMEQTYELQALIVGLQSATSFDISVCASTCIGIEANKFLRKLNT